MHLTNYVKYDILNKTIVLKKFYFYIQKGGIFMNDNLEKLFLAEFPEAKNGSYFSAFNRAGALGVIEREFKSVFRTQEGVFFESTICVERKSGILDRVRVIVPEKMLTKSSYEGKMVSIVGQIRSSREGNYLWGKSIVECDRNEKMKSLVCLRGEIKEKPYYIPTSTDCSKADIKIIVRRNFDKKDIILGWARGEEARRINRLWKDDTIELSGKIESFYANSRSGKLVERCRILIWHHELLEIK